MSHTVRDAAELLVLLESMLAKDIPLHKLILRVEVSDSFYDKDGPEVYETTYGDKRYLIIQGD